MNAAQVWNRLIPKMPDFSSSISSFKLSGIVAESDAVAEFIDIEISEAVGSTDEGADEADTFCTDGWIVGAADGTDVVVLLTAAARIPWYELLRTTSMAAPASMVEAANTIAILGRW